MQAGCVGESNDIPANAFLMLAATALELHSHPDEALDGDMYGRLTEFLADQQKDDFIVSFVQIEAALRRRLPSAAGRQSWWQPHADVAAPQHDAIRSAGFKAFLVAEKRVRFQRFFAFDRPPLPRS